MATTMSNAIQRLAESLEQMAGVVRSLRAEIADHGERVKRIETLLSLPEQMAERFISSLTPETLADLLPQHVIDRSRAIQYARRNGLPPPPMGPEPAPRADEHTGIFDRTHTDGTERRFKEVVGGAAIFLARKGWPWFLAAGSAAATHLAHLAHLWK